MPCVVPSVTLPKFETLIAELISLPSISSPITEWDLSNEPVIECLAAWFSQIGFKTDVQAVPSLAGKYNLIATLGSGSEGLVLSGHTDTVPYDQKRWQSDPFKLVEKDQRLFGLGACDMKGFFAVIVESLRQLEGAALTQPIIILATADEESSMSGARAISEQGLGLGRAAVIGEPTGLKPIRMHKGMMMQSIRIHGRSGHSSNPTLGNSALEAMYYIMTELLSLRDEMQRQNVHEGFEVDRPTMNLGHIHGGDSPNRICGHCELSIDVRPLPGMSINDIRAAITERCNRVAHEGNIKVELVELFGGIPAFEQPANSELVAMCERLTGVASGSVAFATEAPYLQGLGMETIVMGAGSIDQAHQPNEYLALDQITPMANTLTGLISHYCLAS